MNRGSICHPSAAIHSSAVISSPRSISARSGQDLLLSFLLITFWFCPHLAGSRTHRSYILVRLETGLETGAHAVVSQMLSGSSHTVVSQMLSGSSHAVCCLSSHMLLSASSHAVVSHAVLDCCCFARAGS
jgi:hypothetical protein